MSYRITKIKARQILDSRGNPTVEATVYAGDDFAVASVPSGASTGSHEALELRDGKNSYGGLSVTQAVKNIETVINRLLKGMDVREQEQIDEAMIQKDGTYNKSKLGANAILAVSLAVARLAAQQSKLPLYRYLHDLSGLTNKMAMPVPLFNVLNGGLHADSGLDIQEFFLIAKAKKFEQRIEHAWLVIKKLKQLLSAKKYVTSVGDEGGFAPRLGSNRKALLVLKQSIEQVGLKFGKDVALGMDAAATEFFDMQTQTYRLTADKKNYKPLSVYKLYQKWTEEYSLEVIEDGCAEDDMPGWQKLTQVLGDKVTLVGDDLFVTQHQRLQTGIISGIANAVLIKLNQVGTVTETLATISLAKKYNYKVIVSHRSGETMDDFIADLSVAVSADYIKAGSLARGERLAKYNRLLAIAAELKQ
ncbi:MAG: phosphopyruvate hydratase [Candidatus Doudnabacteria bacterium]